MRHRMPAASWETIACLIAGVAATLPHTLGLAAAAAGFQGGDYRQAAAAVAGPDRCLSSAVVLQCLEDLLIHCLPHIPSHIHVVASAEASSSHAVQVLLAVEATIAAQRGVIRAWLGTL